MDSLNDRGLLLLEKTSLSALAKPGTKQYTRWQNIKRGQARLAADEIEALAKAHPQYRWWLLTGDVMPEIGQTSPEYDEANKNLPNHNAG